jgi:hypothetical protein
MCHHCAFFHCIFQYISLDSNWEYGIIEFCSESISNMSFGVICFCGISSDCMNNLPIVLSLFIKICLKYKNPPQSVRLSGGGNFSILQ